MAILNAKFVCSWFHFTPHPTQDLVAQGYNQGYGTGKDGFFPATSGCLIILRALLWAPNTSVVDLVLRLLGYSVHKRPNSLHVFICLKLMIPVWVRLLFKMANLAVYGPPEGGGGVWPSSM